MAFKSAAIGSRERTFEIVGDQLDHLLAHAAALLSAGVVTLAGAAAAAPVQFGYGGPDHTVFVQTDNRHESKFVVYGRSGNGTLTPAGTYNTGGLGGILAGSAVDHTASQGSLAYDPVDSQLYAVNAGSSTVSVFAVKGSQLSLRQVVRSGGTFPVSIAVHGSLVEVLNAENGGSVQGFFAFPGRLIPLPYANRSLGLDPTATLEFVDDSVGPGLDVEELSAHVHPGGPAAWDLPS